MQNEHPSLQARVEKFGRHLLVERGMARTTVRLRTTIVRKFLRDHQTLQPRKEQVQEAKESMLIAGYSRDYVGNMCSALRHYGEFLGLDLQVKPPSPDKKQVPRYLTEEEVQAILYVVDSVRDRALLSVLAYTGLRCQELVNLRRSQLDFENEMVTVQHGKGGKSAEVPVSPIALRAASEYLRSGAYPESEFLFCTPAGDRLSTNRVRVLCRKYGNKAGIRKGVSPHMFRHALATNLLANGCPLPYVQRQLRHSRIETTMRYLHLSDKDLRRNYSRFVPSY